MGWTQGRAKVFLDTITIFPYPEQAMLKFPEGFRILGNKPKILLEKKSNYH